MLRAAQSGYRAGPEAATLGRVFLLMLAPTRCGQTIEDARGFRCGLGSGAGGRLAFRQLFISGRRAQRARSGSCMTTFEEGKRAMILTR